MPYIVFPELPKSTGRTVMNACTDPVSGEYACEVDELRDGDTEITADRYAAIRAAAEQAYAKAVASPVLSATGD